MIDDRKDPIAILDVLGTMALAAAIFIGVDPDGSVWRKKVERLEKYEAIASSPEALQQALNTYDRLYDTVLSCEHGIGFKPRHNVVIDCSRIETPQNPRMWLAGL